MYNAASISARLQGRPFVPLRITTSSGEAFDIYHPDLVLVGIRDVTIGLPAADDPAHYDQQVRVSILHISTLRDLPVPTAPPA